MRALCIVRQALDEQLGFLHAKRLEALWRGIGGILSGGQLWLTALGRDLPGGCSDKHRIKAADRLLGNEGLHACHLDLARVLASYLIGEMKQVCILVDWTGVGPHHHILTAALALDGRSLPIFSRVYPDTSKQSPTAEREFLNELALVIPKSCRPTIITDAGFHIQWFEQVAALGWDFLGRLRNRAQLQVKEDWLDLADVHLMAGRQPRDLGVIPVRRLRPRALRVVLSKRVKTKGRKSLTTKGKPRQRTDDKKLARAAREPLVLVTSLRHSPAKVIARYKLRMRIEETFRDLKAHRHGWALDFTRSKSPARIQVLSLLASFALVVMRVLGLAADSSGLRYRYQANTVRSERVLSTFFLARLVIRDGTCDTFSLNALHKALTDFFRHIQRASTPT